MPRIQEVHTVQSKDSANHKRHRYRLAALKNHLLPAGVSSAAGTAVELDVIVVGAGFSGMYLLYKFRKMGLKVKVLEMGSGVGGTWYWNRYPGARCDVPSVEYSYSFDKELEKEWEWSEMMAAQPEIEDYANHVASRFDLRKDIQFDTQVTSMTYDESRRRWVTTTASGGEFTSAFAVSAVGCLSSAPNMPDIYHDCVKNFDGAVYHTGKWPKEDPDFTGKRVGVVGTGSSGIQAIPIIAKAAQTLTVFQRTPQYSLPAHNHSLDKEYIQHTKV
jgi:cyclohexanone monooxygenase